MAMTPAEIIALANLAATLAPPVLEFVNNMVKAFEAGNLSGADRMKAIEELQAKLAPMKPIPES